MRARSPRSRAPRASPGLAAACGRRERDRLINFFCFARREKLDRGHYVGIHSSGFRDFILKPECLRAVVDCGFEHPSEG